MKKTHGQFDSCANNPYVQTAKNRKPGDFADQVERRAEQKAP